MSYNIHITRAESYMEDETDSNSRVHIYFDHRSPCFSVREESHMLPIIELAEMIHGKDQGDEEEIYTRESVLAAC